MELCLGTVQFGMDYGIRGQKKPYIDDTLKMLDYATQNGIRSIDTANAYGTSEDVIGKFISRHTIARDELFIVSKCCPNLLDDHSENCYYTIIKNNLSNSLSRLHIDYLDTYLLHSSRYVYNDMIVAALNRLKKEGYARKVGVSVYEPDEAKKCIEHPNIDFMQLPYSIFDQRMLQNGVFDLADGRNIQIHSRSAFIQGLILMEENEVPPFLYQAKPILRKIKCICQQYGISRIELAMGFVKCQDVISHIVFGVDNMEQLREDIAVFTHSVPKTMIDEISKEFTSLQTDIVMPSLWKK